MSLSLGYGFSFSDLYDRTALTRLDGAFVDHLRAADAALTDRLMTARAAHADLAAKDESDLLIALGPYVESFIAGLFGIETEVKALAGRASTLAPVYEVKRLFVQRIAAKKFKPEEAVGFDPQALCAAMDLSIVGPRRRAEIRPARPGVGAGRQAACGAARRRRALCGVGHADRGGQGEAP